LEVEDNELVRDAEKCSIYRAGKRRTHLGVFYR
jgi:hypothetical protein